MLFSDKLVFGLRHTDILEQITQLESSDCGKFHLFVRCFSPYKSIFTDVFRTEERQSSVSQKILEISLDPCCLSDFIYCREVNSLSMLDLTSNVS